MPIRRYQPRLKTCTAINTEMMTLSPDDRARDRFLADGATGRLSVCAIATIYLSICLQAASTWAIAMPQALAVIGVLSLASSGAGHLILRAFDDRTSITRPAIEIIIGVIALGYTLFAARFFFGMDIRIAAGVFAALGCAGFLMLLRDSRIAGVRQDDSGFAALALLLACAGFSAIWSLESVSRLLESQADGRFRFWSDMFIHAGTIAELGDWRDAGRGAMALADMPAALYHYVSFTFPALLTAMTDMPGLSAIFAVWLPLGILLLALAVAAAGHELGGAAGSLASVVLLVALPDPSMYGLENGFLGFHWLLETAPTTLYGLALCCLSLIWLKRWCETGDWRQLLLSILLMAAVYFARAHLLAWFLPSWAYVVLWQLMSMRPSLRWPAIAAATAAGLAALIAINWKNAQPDVPDFLFRYIEFVNLYQNPTAYDGLYAWLMSALGRAGAAPIGILLTVIAMIGAPLLTFLLLFAMALRQRRLDVIDVLPVALLLFACLMLVFAPTPPRSDWTDLRHRPYPWLVIVMLLWNARLALKVFPAVGSKLLQPAAALLPVVALLASYWGAGAWKAPRFAWGERYQNFQIDPDLAAAARYVRAQSGPRDAFVMADQPADEVYFDAATIVLGSSGVPAWVSRPGVIRAGGGPNSAAAAARLAILARANAAPDFAAAAALLSANGATWYIATAAADAAWDKERSLAAFRHGHVAVYSLTSR
jgi:hypothetical protein